MPAAGEPERRPASHKPREVVARDDLQRIWVDILMALLGLIQGLIFNDLANKFSKHMIADGGLNWTVACHLAFCLAVLLRVIQTYITAALYYRKDLQIGEILIMTVIGALQHLLAESIRDPGAEADAVDLGLFHGTIVAICALASLGYWLTLRSLVRKYFGGAEPEDASAFSKTVVLQFANIAGLAFIALASSCVLWAGAGGYAGWAAASCGAVLMANTTYSSRLSFVATEPEEAPDTGAGDRPRTICPHWVGAGLVREFDYVFGEFLPRDSDPARTSGVRARIIALAMCFFPRGQLLGTGALVAVNGPRGPAGFAVAGGRPGVLPGIQTILAFGAAILVYDPFRVLQSAVRAWRGRELLFPPVEEQGGGRIWKIHYLVTDPAERRAGAARRLLGDLEEAAVHNGAASIVACVRANNLAARLLFRRAGYRKTRKYRSLARAAPGLGGIDMYAKPLRPAEARTAQIRAGRRGGTLLRWISLVAAGIAAIAVMRTTWVTDRQPRPFDATPIPPSPVDLMATLSQAIRLRTVSQNSTGKTQPVGGEFDRLNALLQQSFPTVFAGARVERVNGSSLLELPSSKPGAGSILLYAHLDVVPAESTGWNKDPFSGEIADGFVHGRGAIDDKFSVVAILAAAEVMTRSGRRPDKTVYLAFGHDEELDGEGARAIAARLQALGVRVDSLLDEGGGVVKGKIPGVAAPVAAVGVAEKGYLDVEICAAATAGHSSAPPPSTAVGVVANAIARLEADPPPGALNALVRQTLTFPASRMSLPFRFLMSNLWLAGPLVERELRADPMTKALLGSTQAVTMVSGGTKANVLPSKACATVNYRLFPGSSSGDIEKRIRRIAAGLAVTITLGEYVPPPKPSDIGSPEGGVLGRSIASVFPGSVVVPVLTPGTTDSRHFGAVATSIFRFSPLELGDADLASIHGVNERIGARGLESAYRFYYTYLYHAAGWRQ